MVSINFLISRRNTDFELTKAKLQSKWITNNPLERAKNITKITEFLLQYDYVFFYFVILTNNGTIVTLPENFLLEIGSAQNN